MLRSLVVLGLVAGCGDNWAPNSTFTCGPLEEPLPGVNGIFSEPSRVLPLSTDLNNDGKLDLVTLAGQEGGPVASTFLGNGDGTFQPRIDYFDVGRGGGAFAVGDFDRDGNVDLAIASLDPNPLAYWFGIHILLGNGDGTLRPDEVITVGNASDAYGFGLTISDFNNDSCPDLLVGAGHLILGNCNGSFQPVRLIGPGGVGLIGVDDVNRDGRADIVVSAWTSCTSGTGSSPCEGVEVLFGNGDGTFQAPSGFVIQPQIDFLWSRLIDVTGDNFVDLVGMLSGDQGNDLLAIRRGNGDGTFQDSSITSSVTYLADMAFGDLNQDGMLDVAVTHTYRDDTVSILLGHGDATFGPPAEYAAGGHTPQDGNVTLPGDHPIVGDFNGDQVPDVVSGLVLLGNGDGTLQSWRVYPTAEDPNVLGPDYNAPVSAADLDGDGEVDVVVATRATISVLRALGPGVFDIPTNIGTLEGAYIYALAIEDFNRDGVPDIAAVQQGSVAVMLNNGDGTFRSEIDSTFAGGGGYWSQSFGDLDGDGNVDLVVVGAGSLTVLFGNGDGTFRPGSEIRLDQTCSPVVETYHSVLVADVDNDRALDLVVTTEPPGGRNAPTATCFGVSVFYGSGAGSFSDEHDMDKREGVGKQYAVVADVNGDGVEDVIAVGGDDLTFLGAGGRTFGSPKDVTAPSASGGTYRVADMDGDGTPDLLVADDRSLDIYPGKGDGTFGTVTSLNVGSIVASFALADLNADRAPDLIVPFRGYNQVAVLLRSCGPGD